MENKEILTVEEDNIKVQPDAVVEVAEAVETEKEPAKQKKVIDGKFFKKIGDNIKAKINTTKHNMRVVTQINHSFAENASRYTLLDTAVKGLSKILLEKDDTKKTFTFLGKLKLKDKSILKDKEDNMFKITGLVQGEHKRMFVAENEEHERELTVYSFIEI